MFNYVLKRWDYGFLMINDTSLWFCSDLRVSHLAVPSADFYIRVFAAERSFASRSNSVSSQAVPLSCYRDNSVVCSSTIAASFV